MQVFWNVIKNAIKFTRDGGAIHIESTNEAGKVLVRVTDNGIGIEPEVLPRIFDSFEQGVRRVQAGHGGLGSGSLFPAPLSKPITDRWRRAARAGIAERW